MIVNLLLFSFPFLFLFIDFFSGMLVSSILVVCFSLLVLKTIPMEMLQFNKLSEFFMGDEVVFWLVLITLLILLTSIFVYSSMGELVTTFFYYSVFMLLASSVFMFMSSDLLLMYIMYEFSLFPIIYIILKWGYYSDRSVSAIYMLLYTTVFSFPLISFVIYYFYNTGVFSVTFTESFIPFWLLCLMLLSFLVKLPLYGLHLWLPMAHVEAPTFGSMILAGILLKLGGFGLFRLVFVTAATSSGMFLSEYLWSYVMISMLVVSVVASMQSDFKRLVAYSSVIHMTFFVLVLFSQNLLGSKALLMVMILHGILSPALFLLVGLLYSMQSTRLLFILTSIYLVSPIILSLISVFLFSMNVPVPPFPQFLTEVMSLMSFSFYSTMIYWVVIPYVFMSLLYNLVWFLPTTLLPTFSFSNGTYPFFHLVLLLYYILYLIFILFFMSLF